MIQNFISALQFLTIIRLNHKTEDEQTRLAQSLVYFPLVGIVLGAVLAGVNQLLTHLSLEPLLVNVILVTLLIIFTGGLHLDGLADTFDALLSRKPREQMLEVMRDAHIGTMGVLSLVVMILWKLALLYSLPPQMVNLSLIFMSCFSRYAMVLAIFTFPYARQEGKARVFISGANSWLLIGATAITLLAAFGAFGLKGEIILLAVSLAALWWGRFLTCKLGGLTGDTLGALNELSEVLTLLMIYILTKGG